MATYLKFKEDFYVRTNNGKEEKIFDKGEIIKVRFGTYYEFEREGNKYSPILKPTSIRFLDGELKGKTYSKYIAEIFFNSDKIEWIEISRTITKKQRYEILKRQEWCCNLCGCTLKYGKKNTWDGEVAHIDHIFPFSKWREYSNPEEINDLDNLQALCPTCNLTKTNKIIC